jgi:3-oxoacyl-[acyl-carrier protein] reductase
LLLHTFVILVMSSVAIVTGGSGGMGGAIGLELSSRSVGTIVFAQRREATEAVAAVEAAGGRALSLPLDVSTQAGVGEFFAAFSAQCDRLDYLVNVSGECPRTAIEDVTEEELFASYAINASGPFFMCQAARPIMWRSGGGAIVNIGSVAGEDGAFAASPAYSMAKGALKSMMMHLSKRGFPPAAYLPGALPKDTFPYIRINNVSPGPVATDMLRSMAPGDLQNFKVGALTGQITEVAEISKAVAYLLLDARNTTGQTMGINGGITRT